VRKKHKLDNTTWERLGSDEGDALVEKVEAESIRRQRDGSTKRELAQKHIVRGPEILNSIAADSSASPRHRVDAIKVLDTMSATGPEAAPASDRFVIQINLGADTLRFRRFNYPAHNGVRPRRGSLLRFRGAADEQLPTDKV
jgi:hypothetical protein